jgi:hypothetical protein
VRLGLQKFKPSHAKDQLYSPGLMPSSCAIANVAENWGQPRSTLTLHAPQVLGDLVKRLVNGVVLLLGSLAFFLVPVGDKTTAQHVMAIFSTRPAKEAAVAFARAGRQMTSQIVAEVERAKKNPPSPSDMKIKPAPPSP